MFNLFNLSLPLIVTGDQKVHVNFNPSHLTIQKYLGKVESL